MKVLIMLLIAIQSYISCATTSKILRDESGSQFSKYAVKKAGITLDVKRVDKRDWGYKLVVLVNNSTGKEVFIHPHDFICMDGKNEEKITEIKRDYGDPDRKGLGGKLLGGSSLSGDVNLSLGQKKKIFLQCNFNKTTGKFVLKIKYVFSKSNRKVIVKNLVWKLPAIEKK